MASESLLGIKLTTWLKLMVLLVAAAVVWYFLYGTGEDDLISLLKRWPDQFSGLLSDLFE